MGLKKNKFIKYIYNLIWQEFLNGLRVIYLLMKYQ